tara:strand:- start:414 stop:833 length:420 start_codon:yes stop_codon:yes gene_type:complete
MLFEQNKKCAALIITILFYYSTFLYAGCGSCGPRAEVEVPLEKKSSSFISTVPESGKIEGFVIASCGICNLGYKKNKGCSLTIKIGDTVYSVEGTKMHNHGDAHSPEGFCNAIRLAHVSGKIKKNKFYSDSFTLIESPE